MLSCKEANLLVSQSLDRRLSWRERVALRLHLLVCDACRAFERQTAFLRTAARQLASRETHTSGPLRLSSNARERIMRLLRTGRR